MVRKYTRLVKLSYIFGIRKVQTNWYFKKCIIICFERNEFMFIDRLMGKVKKLENPTVMGLDQNLNIYLFQFVKRT